jgi:hypothetical protein
MADEYDWEDIEDEDVEAIELLGALMDDEDPILGLRVPRGRGIGPRRRRRVARKALAKALVPRTPGVPAPGGREQPLGFEPIQFTDASALILEMVCEPDRPFKGRRLIIDAVRSAAGIGGLLTVRRFDIGGKNQLASREPVTITAFQPDATLSILLLDPITPGVPGVLEIEASVQPTTSATVDVGAALYGLSIS